ncbi:LysR substrate-binding domain-containing protein [Limoniibacter endophyticus]|uniref:LysR family transcriptional regulator n=1 Tax=Limoniibacter endophyticus TaxID=1565040 RepID=A0A8J3DMP1_9HYPH|nr:LysR substrate-binding domain-containing protein [Limoniibacter endophyticus]GHC68021.1 LysR family transcriptional regulator [Limoniibacter endophyticus]
MKLIHFSAFRAVMLTGTVSAAAELIGRSQPAVSRLLDKLEAELGVTLFERRKGLITPTSIAHLLLDEIDRAYTSLDSLRNFAARVAEGETSRITTAVMPALGISFMPWALKKFKEEWPQTRVHMSIRLSAKIEEWAASQQLDFGLAELPFRRSGFQTEIFSDAPYIAAVPKGHPLAARDKIEPQDLRGHPFVSFASFTAAGPIIAQAFRSAGEKLDPAYEITISAAAYEFAKIGLAIALIDPYTAIHQLDDRVTLVPFHPKIPFNVALLRPYSRPQSRVSEALLGLLRIERDTMLAKLPRL